MHDGSHSNPDFDNYPKSEPKTLMCSPTLHPRTSKIARRILASAPSYHANAQTLRWWAMVLPKLHLIAGADHEVMKPFLVRLMRESKLVTLNPQPAHQEVLPGRRPTAAALPGPPGLTSSAARLQLSYSESSAPLNEEDSFLMLGIPISHILRHNLKLRGTGLSG